MSLKRMKSGSKDAPEKKDFPSKPDEEEKNEEDIDDRKMLIIVVSAAILLVLIFFSAIVLLICHTKESHRPSTDPFRPGRSMITMSSDISEDPLSPHFRP